MAERKLKEPGIQTDAAAPGRAVTFVSECGGLDLRHIEKQVVRTIVTPI